MPIRFRCHHCRQFLGISGSRAGSIVDCPTCGRAVRVPQQDGRAEPVPDPELNLQDPSLADVLDQLAAIGQAPAGDSATRTGGPPSEKVHEPPPAPQPEPIEIEPPLPAEPVVQPPAAARAVDSRTSAATLEAPEEVLQELNHQTPRGATAAPSPAPRSRRRAPRRKSRDGWSFVLFAGIVMLLGAVAGFAYVAGKNRSADSPESAPADNAKQAVQNNRPPAGKEAAQPAVTGRVTYKTGDGTSRPDRNARVLVFPDDRKGQVKLSVVGFRSADAEIDFRAGRAALRELGGDVASVDEEGSFQLFLPEAGGYHILVLSSHRLREEGEEAPGLLMELLQSYFDRPDSLLGRVRYHFGRIRYNGEKTEDWYHSFDAN